MVVPCRTTSFSYIYADLARGIVKAMSSPAAHNEELNLSTAESTTVRQLAELIWTKINGDGPLSLHHDPAFEHDVQRRVPDVAKARDVLGFEATTTLTEMLDVVIPWVRQAMADGVI